MNSSPTTHPTNYAGASCQNGYQVRIALLLASVIDCEILATLLEREPTYRIMHASTSQFHIRERFLDTRPHLFIADPKCGPDFVAFITEAVISGLIPQAIIFDERVHEAVVTGILPFTQVSYLTRQSGIRGLLHAIDRIRRGERVFDPSVASRIARTARGWRLLPTPGQPSIAALTARELEIFKLLAVGQSVRDCAKQLHLSESTIDNHKSRLMKKLHIHKITELAHLAIRDGLITV